MKKFLALFLTLTLFVGSFATVSIQDPPRKATEIFIPVGKSGEKISLMELSQIKPSDYETLTGRNMNFLEKWNFKLAQRQLRKSISSDGTIDNKKLSNFFEKRDNGSGGFHLGGFALGFLLGLIGILIAYLIKDDKKSTRVKWAWIGLAIGLVLYLVLVLA